MFSWDATFQIRFHVRIYLVSIVTFPPFFYCLSMNSKSLLSNETSCMWICMEKWIANAAAFITGWVETLLSWALILVIQLLVFLVLLSSCLLAWPSSVVDWNKHSWFLLDDVFFPHPYQSWDPCWARKLSCSSSGIRNFISRTQWCPRVGGSSAQSWWHCVMGSWRRGSPDSCTSWWRWTVYVAPCWGTLSVSCWASACDYGSWMIMRSHHTFFV